MKSTRILTSGIYMLDLQVQTKTMRQTITTVPIMVGLAPLRPNMNIWRWKTSATSSLSLVTRFVTKTKMDYGHWIPKELMAGGQKLATVPREPVIIRRAR